MLADENGFLTHLRILVLGAARVGKSALVSSFIGGEGWFRTGNGGRQAQSPSSATSPPAQPSRLHAEGSSVDNPRDDSTGGETDGKESVMLGPYEPTIEDAVTIQLIMPRNPEYTAPWEEPPPPPPTLAVQGLSSSASARSGSFSGASSISPTNNNISGSISPPVISPQFEKRRPSNASLLSFFSNTAASLTGGGGSATSAAGASNRAATAAIDGYYSRPSSPATAALSPPALAASTQRIGGGPGLFAGSSSSPSSPSIRASVMSSSSAATAIASGGGGFALEGDDGSLSIADVDYVGGRRGSSSEPMDERQRQNRQQVVLTVVEVGGAPCCMPLWGSASRDADAVLLVYDVTNRKSFDVLWHLVKKVAEAQNRLPKEIPFLLVGTCVDTVGRGRVRQVPMKTAHSFAKLLGIPCMETTARASRSVRHCFRALIYLAQERAHAWYDQAVANALQGEIPVVLPTAATSPDADRGRPRRDSVASNEDGASEMKKKRQRMVLVPGLLELEGEGAYELVLNSKRAGKISALLQSEGFESNALPKVGAGGSKLVIVPATEARTSGFSEVIASALEHRSKGQHLFLSSKSPSARQHSSRPSDTQPGVMLQRSKSAGAPRYRGIQAEQGSKHAASANTSSESGARRLSVPNTGDQDPEENSRLSIPSGKSFQDSRRGSSASSGSAQSAYSGSSGSSKHSGADLYTSTSRSEVGSTLYSSRRPSDASAISVGSISTGLTTVSAPESSSRTVASASATQGERPARSRKADLKKGPMGPGAPKFGSLRYRRDIAYAAWRALGTTASDGGIPPIPFMHPPNAATSTNEGTSHDVQGQAENETTAPGPSKETKASLQIRIPPRKESILFPPGFNLSARSAGSSNSSVGDENLLMTPTPTAKVSRQWLPISETIPMQPKSAVSDSSSFPIPSTPSRAEVLDAAGASAWASAVKAWSTWSRLDESSASSSHESEEQEEEFTRRREDSDDDDIPLAHVVRDKPVLDDAGLDHAPEADTPRHEDATQKSPTTPKLPTEEGFDEHRPFQRGTSSRKRVPTPYAPRRPSKSEAKPFPDSPDQGQEAHDDETLNRRRKRMNRASLADARKSLLDMMDKLEAFRSTDTGQALKASVGPGVATGKGGDIEEGRMIYPSLRWSTAPVSPFEFGLDEPEGASLDDMSPTPQPTIPTLGAMASANSDSPLTPSPIEKFASQESSEEVRVASVSSPSSSLRTHPGERTSHGSGVSSVSLQHSKIMRALELSLAEMEINEALSSLQAKDEELSLSSSSRRSSRLTSIASDDPAESKLPATDPQATSHSHALSTTLTPAGLLGGASSSNVTRPTSATPEIKERSASVAALVQKFQQSASPPSEPQRLKAPVTEEQSKPQKASTPVPIEPVIADTSAASTEATPSDGAARLEQLRALLGNMSEDEFASTLASLLKGR
ncbi:Ras- protein Rab-39A [Phlyctochytrium bullatum]|nr:Ras- protein Rab-39A [Phlyctochytrium bullatum]